MEGSGREREKLTGEGAVGVQIRKILAVTHDPYIPWLGPKEVAVCRRCGAVYHRKHWTLRPSPSGTRGRKIRLVLCPGCQKIRDHFPGGILTLKGNFLNPHKDEILHLIRNEEARARKINPLERIISIKDQKTKIEVQTTSDRFTQRIGMEIHRAYKGRVTYRWPGEDKFVRVEWHRGNG